MIGLSRATAATASLLLNFESLFTALLAWFAFKEHAGRRVVVGMLSVFAGGVVLSGVVGGHGRCRVRRRRGSCSRAWDGRSITTSPGRFQEAMRSSSRPAKGVVAGTVNFAIALVDGQVVASPSAG
jgi:hypothetical protein